MKIKGKLSRSERNWILYDVANSSYGLIIMTAIMPLYYKGYIAEGVGEAVSTADWGFANSAAGLVVAVLAPFLGAVADVKGNKKVFLGIFMTLGILATAMLSTTAPGMRFATLSIYAMSLVAFTGSCVFYDSLLVDVTSRKRMDWISGAGYAWGYVGGGIPYILCIALIYLGEKGGDKTTMVKLSFIITAIWWALFSLPVLLGTQQKYVVKTKTGTVGDALRNLWKTVKKIRQYRNIVLFLPAYFLYIDGVDTIIQMAVPYGKDIGLDSTLLMLTVLGLQFTAFPFALLYGRLATYYSTKLMLFIAIGIYMVITFLGYLLPSVDSVGVKTGIFFLLAFLIATSQGGIQALSRSFYSRIIPRDQAAEFFGFYNIFGKFATILGPLLVAIAGRWMGHAKYGILSLCFLFLAGGICLALVKEESPRKSRGAKA